MPKDLLPDYVIDALQQWAGWPSQEWLVTTVARKHHRTKDDVDGALASLCKQGIVAKVQHKDEIVFRME
jgi:hypothetical protein